MYSFVILLKVYFCKVNNFSTEEKAFKYLAFDELMHSFIAGQDIERLK